MKCSRCGLWTISSPLCPKCRQSPQCLAEEKARHGEPPSPDVARLPQICSTLEAARQAVDQITYLHGLTLTRLDEWRSEYASDQKRILLDIELMVVHLFGCLSTVAFVPTLRLAKEAVGAPYSAGLPGGRRYRTDTMNFAEDLARMWKNLMGYLRDFHHPGRLQRWNAEKGYGFIVSADGNEIFCPQSAIPEYQHRHIQEGQSIRYQLVPAEVGREAAHAVFKTF